MAPLVPTLEPTTARAGATWLWDRAFPDYPSSDGWVLTYILAGPGRISIPASMMTADGDGWHVTVPASTTAEYVPGAYEVQAILTGSGTYAGRVDTISLPGLDLQPNLSKAAPGERVSHAQRMLTLVRTAIEARVRGDEPEFYAIDGSSAKAMSMDQLQKLEIRYAAQVARERRPGQFGTRVQFRITPVSP